MTKTACPCLNTYLAFGRHRYEPDRYEPPGGLLLSANIEGYSAQTTEVPEDTKPVVEGTWEFFKKLRKYGLSNTQSLLLIDHFVLGKTIADIARERDWTSVRTAQRHFKQAIDLLRGQGFKGEIG